MSISGKHPAAKRPRHNALDTTKHVLQLPPEAGVQNMQLQGRQFLVTGLNFGITTINDSRHLLPPCAARLQLSLERLPLLFQLMHFGVEQRRLPSLVLE